MKTRSDLSLFALWLALAAGLAFVAWYVVAVALEPLAQLRVLVP